MMEDFWNNEDFFSLPFLGRNEILAVNVRENKNGFELEVAAPGFKKDDFKVTTDNRILTISAESKDEKKEEKDGYTSQEFSCSSFARAFTLPTMSQNDHVTAAYQDGVLKIGLKKTGKNTFGTQGSIDQLKIRSLYCRLFIHFNGTGLR